MSDRSSGSSRRSRVRQGSRKRESKTEKPYQIATKSLYDSSEEEIVVSKSISQSTVMAMTSSASEMNVAEVTNMINRLPSDIGTEAQFAAAVASFLTDCSGKLVDWVNNTIAFAGFDAVRMRKTILSKIGSGGIIVCVLIGLVRGNNVDRISKTMKNPDFHSHFKTAVKALKLVNSVGGNYSAITLSRMIACFPETVCQILSQHALPMAIEISELRGIHEEFPQVARHQACASILPDSLTEGNLYKALDVIMVPYIKTSDVINSKNKDWNRLNNDAKMEKARMYLNNSYNSKILTSEARLSLCKSLNIMSNSTNLSSTWLSVSISCKDWLRKKYNVTVPPQPPEI